MAMMSIYETFAHALINEHGRTCFTKKSNHSYSQNYGFTAKFWRLLLLAYGKKFYDLPAQLGLTPEVEGQGFGYPAFSAHNVAKLGISPSEGMRYKTVKYDPQYSPINFGTAILKYGTLSSEEEAKSLLTVSFLRSVGRERTPFDWATNTVINPYAPADVGRKPFDPELLSGPDGSPYLLDELGTAAWFPPEHTVNILKKVEPVHWYRWITSLNNMFGLWAPFLAETSSVLLAKNQTGQKDTYSNGTVYLRNCSPSRARSWLSRVTGNQKILGVVRADATPREMASGLSTLFANQNVRTEAVLCSIGRPLTIEDFREMTPKCVLSSLYYTPYGAIEEVTKQHSNELGGMMFTLTDKKLLPLVAESMSVHRSRPKNWNPDVKGDLLQPRIEGWEKIMRPLVTDYLDAKTWRDELLPLAPPEVLFLALLRWANPGEKDPLPTVAMDNLLRSWSNIVEIQRVISVMPSCAKGTGL